MGNIYSDIYDITKENLETAGGRFTTSKEEFYEICSMHPQDANIFLLSKEKDNKLFMEKSYINILKRFADQSAHKNWEGRFSMQSDEFQRLVVTTLINSTEFAKTDVRVFDNIYSPHNIYKGRLSDAQKAVDVRKAERQLFIYNTLRKMYNKFPESIKKILRKVLAKWR